MPRHRALQSHEMRSALLSRTSAPVVDLCHRHVLVTEKLLNIQDVYPGVKE